MESKKINQLATELAPDLSDLTIIGDPTTGISKKITLSQMASLFTGTVEEYANLAAFPLVGVADTIYIALNTNIIYRWNTGTSAYVELSPNIVTSLIFNDANGFDGTINLVGSTATLTITTALTTGSVGFIGASGALLQDNANFFWDDTNNRLGLGTNAPTTALDVFGSGIIGRINGTSTNNAFLGFSSAGVNKWSVGNVQSNHRYRIYSEANSAELISVLQTGEFGIGIANPTTKFHIDGGASALIANLDAGVSIAKSISFRSDNSNRINLEVSGTESGSNAGANFFLRTYTDAGALLNTPLTISRSTGAATFSIASGIYTAINITSPNTSVYYKLTPTGGDSYILGAGVAQTDDFCITNSTRSTNYLKIIGGASGGAATFSSNITLTNGYLEMPWSNDNKTIWERYNSTTYFQRISSNGAARQLRLESNGAFGNASIVLDGQSNSTVTTSITSDITYVSGKLGIGNPAPDGKLHVFGKTYARYGQDDMFAFYYDDNYRFGLTNPSTDLRQLRVFGKAADGNSFIVFATGNDSERGRFTNGGYFKASVDGTYLSTGAFHEIRSNAVGNLMVLQQTASSGTLYGIDVSYNNQAPNNTTSTFITFYDNVNTKAIIYSNGTFGSRTNTYGSISDIKLKENITPATSKLNDLLKVNVVNYNFIDDEKKEKQIGVISQELEKIFPNMVFESEDYEEVEIINEEGNISKQKQYLGTKTKSVKYSIFVPMLIKAMQEQQAQIEELKTKIK
jgi:hypothetical protein